ncbi:hypothetical protein J4218_01860 [Candidatus Pacearchaeota archaeon]|nr:hypothetical protein [uncultured archaeon]MBS3078842.1 hypothetical protein [Candidatus Pacearchaeota archaeon]
MKKGVVILISIFFQLLIPLLFAIEGSNSCQQGYEWNEQLQKCMPLSSPSCQQGYEWNEQLQKCVPNGGSIACQQGTIWNEELGKCVPQENESLCLELIPNHNNPNEERINIIFIGFNYNDINEFKDKIITLVNINGTGTLDDTGLLSEYPFRDYKNKFNVWYINKLSHVNKTIYDDYFIFKNISSELSSSCPQTNKQEIRLIKLDYNDRSRAGLGEITFFDFGGADMIYFRSALLHEFGHSFGNLEDEYEMDSIAYYLPDRVNVDIANDSVACSKWCNGVPIISSNLYGKNCEDALDGDSCYNKRDNQFPCLWGNHLNSSITRCLNIVKLCTDIPFSEECENFKIASFSLNNLSSIIKPCVWITENLIYRNESDFYYHHRCIPKNPGNINIGTDCVNNTGCYIVCGSSNRFRSSLNSRMGNGMRNETYNYISQQHLIKILNSVDEKTTTTTGATNTVFYDEFGDKGILVEGKIESQSENEVLKDSVKENTSQCELIGLRKNKKYCDENREWENQNEANSVCENNFECLSNVCISEKCVNSNLVEKILNWFKRLFYKE